MRECCQKPENLQVIESTLNKTTRVCRVCGARHFEFGVQPGHIGLRAPAEQPHRDGGR